MSSEQQLKGNSLHRQLDLTKKYATENNLDLVNSLQDLGLSAFSGKHTSTGELGKFLKAIEENELNKDTVLLVESLDRLSRQNPLIAFNQFSKILEYGIEIHTIFDNQIYTSENLSTNYSLLFVSIGSMIRAYDESKIKSERLQKSWAYKRDNLDTKILTKTIPAWLEYDEKLQSIKLIPEMARSIRKIFQLSIEENCGSIAITKYLNSNPKQFPKITTSINNNKKIAVWGQSYIKKILDNPAVYGQFQPHKMHGSKRIPDGEAIPNYFPSVITKDEFLLSRDRISQRKVNGSGRKGKTFSNIFSQLLICGDCGANLIFKNKGKPPKGGKYLGCRRASEGSCTAPNWKYDDFEYAFFIFITEIRIEDVFKNSDLKKKKLIIETKVASLKHELNQEQNKYDNLIDKLPMMDKSLLPDINKSLVKINDIIHVLKDQINKQEHELSVITSRNSTQTQQGLIRGINKFKEKMEPNEIKQLRQRLNALIRNLVDKIVINNSFVKPEAWETNLLDPDFIENFNSSRTSRTEYKNIEDFIQSDFGQREWTNFQRYFTVVFKNGEVRRIQPARNSSLTIRSIKMVEFLKQRSQHE